MEGCSESHFSHICNEVEKPTLRDFILERFLEPKSSQDREKVVSKSLQKSTRFFIWFFTTLGSILDPTGDPKILYFSCFSNSWRQEGLQSDPRHLQRSIFQEFGTILGSILEEISKIFQHISNIEQTKKERHKQTDRQTHKQTKAKIPCPICRGRNREAT